MTPLTSLLIPRCRLLPRRLAGWFWPGLLGLLLWGFGPLAAAQAPPRWQLWHSDDATGTQVWLHARGQDVPAFRAITRVPARLGALTAVLMDTDRMPEWVYRARGVHRLDSSGAMAGVSQVITAMPWPLTDREAIVRWRLSQDADSGIVTLRGSADPARLPPRDDLVRMPTLESAWRLIPLPQGQVEVWFEGHGDPGGNLAWPILRLFVDAAVWQAPFQTVIAVRQMVARPEFRDAQLPFIREPAP